MKRHTQLGNKELFKLLKQTQIRFAGNEKLNIYGTLRCKSGKRMKQENRVFFVSEDEAQHYGYRPCGNCLRNDYRKWKDGLI